MNQTRALLERHRLEAAVRVARERAAREWPSSPAWQAAIAAVEDAERALATLRERDPSPVRPA
jgi:hypothetical protein